MSSNRALISLSAPSAAPAFGYHRDDDDDDDYDEPVCHSGPSSATLSGVCVCEAFVTVKGNESWAQQDIQHNPRDTHTRIHTHTQRTPSEATRQVVYIDRLIDCHTVFFHTQTTFCRRQSSMKKIEGLKQSEEYYMALT